MKNSDQLLDLLSTAQDEIEPTRTVSARQPLYPDVRGNSHFEREVLIFCVQYLQTSTLLVGIKAGQLHQGHFNANQYNYLEVRQIFSTICPMSHAWILGKCASACFH